MVFPSSITFPSSTTFPGAPAGPPPNTPLRAYISGRNRPLEVVDYSVDESITSFAPGDMSGGTSTMNISIRADEDADLANRYLACVDLQITLVDASGVEGTPYLGRGWWSGIISKATRAGGRITFVVDSLLTKLNLTKTADPYFGKAGTATNTLYVNNLILNPSAEASLTGYGSVPGTTGVASLTNPTGVTPFAGSYVARLTWSTAATSDGGGINYLQAGLSAGVTYSFSSYVRTNSTQHIRMVVTWQDAGAVTKGISVGTDVASSTSWSRLSASNVTAPTGSTRALISFYSFNASGGLFTDSIYHNWAIADTLDVDAIMLTAGPTIYDYADGSFSNGSWTGTPNASSSQIIVTIASGTGTDATLSGAFRYYLGLCDIGSDQILIDPDFDHIYVSLPRWTGIVLDYIKHLCSAYFVEIAVINGIIQVRKPRGRIVRIENPDAINTSVTSQGTARRVVVNNHNNRWLSDTVVADVTTVYSISDNGTSFSLKTSHSLTTINNPVCVAAITPMPYVSGSGQYSIVDSTNNTVDPSAWTAGGGAVTVALDPNDPFQINVAVIAPDNIPQYTGPFRLATSNNGVDTPALYITGTGVFTHPETMNISTGVALETQTNDKAPTIDNPFIGDASTAHDMGLFAADDSAGALVTGSGSISFDPDANGQEFGTIVGSRFRTKSGIYRITHTNAKRGSVQIDYKMDVSFSDLVNLFAMIFDEFNVTYAGNTFATFNALYPTQLMSDFNVVSANPTMADYNAVYAGANFNDHAVYPYLKEAVVEDGTSRI